MQIPLTPTEQAHRRRLSTVGDVARRLPGVTFRCHVPWCVSESIATDDPATMRRWLDMADRDHGGYGSIVTEHVTGRGYID